MKLRIPYRLGLTVLLLVVLGISVHAQKRNFNWVYGSGVWLRFTPDSLIAMLPFDMPEVSARNASISDTTGQFLLLADDHGIRNALFEQVAGGSIGELAWNVPAGNYLVLPLPGQPDRYGVFINELPPTARAGMVVVDMAANGGAGAVVGATQWYMQGATAKLAATTDSTDQGYWVLQHGEEDDAFHAFHLGVNGLDPEAVVTHTGSTYLPDEGPEGNFFRRGAMNINFQGNMIGAVVNNPAMDSTLVELFHFDRSTGELEFWVSIDQRYCFFAGCDEYEDGFFGMTRFFFRGIDFDPSGRYMFAGRNALEDSNLAFAVVEYDLAVDPDSLNRYSHSKGGGGPSQPFPWYDTVYGSFVSCSPLGHVNSEYPGLGEAYMLSEDPSAWGYSSGSYRGFEAGGGASSQISFITSRQNGGLPVPCKRYHDDGPTTGGAGPLPVRVTGVRPNPMVEQAILQFSEAARPKQVIWRNLLGQVLRRDPVGRLGQSFVLKRRGLPNGLYLVEVLAKDHSLGVVKVICE